MYEPKPQPETAQAAIDELGITITTEFVPWSESRSFKPNAKASDLSLNWKVSFWVKGREILTSDYGAGQGYCPSHPKRWDGKMTIDEAAAIRLECEEGYAAIELYGSLTPNRRKPILPKITDVLSCLVSDADAIDHPTFESWASDLGYDPDSRKAETIYRACLETALKLRAGLGEAAFQRLREAFQDY